MPNKSNIELISRYRSFKRNYKPFEILGELKNLIDCGRYEDFLVIVAGEGGRAMRIASNDSDLRYGDLFYMLEMAKKDLLEDL